MAPRGVRALLRATAPAVLAGRGARRGFRLAATPSGKKGAKAKAEKDFGLERLASCSKDKGVNVSGRRQASAGSSREV